MEEITNFIANYFDDSVDDKARDLPRNVIRIEQDKSDVNLLEIFYCNIGHAPNECTVQLLDHRVAYAYVLSICRMVEECVL